MRSLTVYRLYQPRGSNYIKVPEVRLSGKWLQELGFDISQRISVRVQKGLIVIRPTD